MRQILFTFLLGTSFVFAVDLEVGVHPSLLLNQVDTKIPDQVQNINKNSNGVVTQGQATSKATAAVTQTVSNNSWNLALKVNGMTTAFTHSYSYPLPSVSVDVDAYITSPSYTAKQIYLSEGGFSSSSSQSQVSSNIQFSNLNVCASGLFPNLKEKIVYKRAWQELMNQKSSQEAQISMEIATEINQTVDKKVQEQISKMQKEYKDSFYIPVIEKGGLKGKTAFATESDKFILAGSLSGKLNRPVFNDLSQDLPLMARLSIPLINKILDSNLIDKTYTGADIAKAIGAEPSEETATIKLVMAKQSPVAFSQDKFVFKLATISRLDKTMNQIEVTMPFKLEKEGTKTLMDLSSPLIVRSMDGKDLSESEKAWVNETFRLILPEIAIELNELKLNFLGREFKPRKVELNSDVLEIAIAQSR